LCYFLCANERIGGRSCQEWRHNVAAAASAPAGKVDAADGFRAREARGERAQAVALREVFGVELAVGEVAEARAVEVRLRQRVAFFCSWWWCVFLVVVKQ
jgi:hypothetical protein